MQQAGHLPIHSRPFKSCSVYQVSMRLNLSHYWISRGHFFLAVFFRVMHDGPSERGTTRSLYYNVKTKFDQVLSLAGRRGLTRANCWQGLVFLLEIDFCVVAVKTSMGLVRSRIKLTEIRLVLFNFLLKFSSFLGCMRFRMQFNNLIAIDVRFSCVCPVFDHECRHNIVKVAVDPRGHSRVDLQNFC